MAESNEVRAIRKYLNEICVRDSSLSSQARARLICFADALASTISRVAGPRKQDFVTGTLVEPIDKELAAKVLELEKIVDDLVPRVLEHRKTTRRKAESNLEAALQARLDAVVTRGKWSADKKSDLQNFSVGEVSEDEAGATLEKAKLVQKLQADVKAVLPGVLDKAETNLTALKSVPLDDLVAEAEARKPMPVSPTLESSRGLTESLAKRMREDRERLRGTN